MAKTDKKKRLLGSQTLTTARLAVFLESLAIYPHVRHACETASLDYRFMYKVRRTNPDVAKKWDEAYEEGMRASEDEAMRRAVAGTKDPVYYQGKIVGYKKLYSDTLTMFMLKGYFPDKYRERVSHEGKNGGPISFVIEGDKE